MARAAVSTNRNARFRCGAVNAVPPVENLMPLMENKTEPPRISRQQMVRSHCLRFMVVPFWLSSKLPPNEKTHSRRASDLRPANRGSSRRRVKLLVGRSVHQCSETQLRFPLRNLHWLRRKCPEANIGCTNAFHGGFHTVADEHSAALGNPK